MHILSARWVIPVEPAGVVLEHHAVVIDGTRIAAILPDAVARTQYPGAEVTSLPNHVLIPGLINLHTHAAMTLLRGLADDQPLMTWLEKHIWPVEAKHLSEAYVFAGTQLACAEMLRSGTTCFADMYFYQEEVARAAREAGMRAMVGGAVMEFPTPYAADADAYIARGLASREQFIGDGKVRLMLPPHAPYTVSDRTFEKLVTIATEMDDLILMCHIHETAGEPTDSERQYGVRAIERLERLGVLGPNLIAVHCVHMTPQEIELFAERGVHVAHCPTSNLKLASGIAPIKAMLEAGVNVGIGTDGCASNNRLDMFAETRLATLLQKGVSGDAAAVPALQALEMATLNAAKALQWDADIGSLKPRKAADVVAVDLGVLETLPVYDAASHLWHAAGRENVSHVWVDGELLLDDHRLTRTDIDALRARTATWGERFRVH
ncbi:MAG: TRZ/ATZ family hydrolase [Nitrosomonadaceae bacterium]|nr:TRZ/ATZ family hydrolase [Nitrosomonadaceae bacterium]